MYASKTGKKGNYLLFGIVIVFQIVDVMTQVCPMTKVG